MTIKLVNASIDNVNDLTIKYRLNQVSKDLIGKPVNAGAVPPL